MFAILLFSFLLPKIFLSSDAVACNEQCGPSRSSYLCIFCISFIFNCINAHPKVCFQGWRAVLSCVWAALTLGGPERQDSRKLMLLNVSSEEMIGEQPAVSPPSSCIALCGVLLGMSYFQILFDV